MAWTSPATAVAGSVLTAAWLNTYVRDNTNLLKTPINDDGTLKILKLLKAGSGTDTTATATTVDSIAITGLTILDRLEAWVHVRSDTQQTAATSLVSTTDSNTLIVSVTGAAAIGANSSVDSDVSIHQSQSTTTQYAGRAIGINGAGTVISAYGIQSLTTAWTGSWTIGLRHGGVTAGGTFRYIWAIFKKAGQ